MRVIIIGGVAGGMSTAARLRRLDESVEIVVVERSGHVSFANCGLPYYVGGVIEHREDLLLQTPESLASRFRIDTRVLTEAVAIDPVARSVQLRDLATGELTTEHYDRLVISTGARPITPPLPGIERALTLRDIEDTDVLAAAAAKAGSAVVIGGGFIGLEVAENLVDRGLRVRLVEAQSQVLAPLDVELAALLHDELRSRGLDLRLNQQVAALDRAGVVLADGSRIDADLVVAAIGVRPDVSLAQHAGLVIGQRGGIVVDEHQLTSDPQIYAVGDAVEKIDALDSSATLVPLANTANLQGRRVADHLAGLPVAARPVLGTAIVKVFDLQAAATGWSEKRLRAAGRPVRVVHTHPADHAGYYPGATTMALKLLIDPQTDQILGAQAVGPAGVDKRIDVIATAMTAGLRASQLADLELAYAPPFGSAKDPVNHLGHIAENLATGTSRTLQWYELGQALAEGASLVDVRSAGEFAAGAIPAAVNLPVDELRDRLDELPAGELVVHCAVGVRGHIAARILTAAGRSVRNLDGGYRTWQAGTSVV